MGLNLYGIIQQPVAAVYEAPAKAKDKNGIWLSAIADEGLYGTGVRLTGDEKDGFVHVSTFYNYDGYVEKSAVRLVSEKDMLRWDKGPLAVIGGRWVDVLSEPDVKGVPLISLPKGSLVWKDQKESAIGWQTVRLADGKTGYVPGQYLKPRLFSQDFLWKGGLNQRRIVDEGAFRRAVVRTAESYLGVQYRWGGRSPLGTDCSGLTSVSYLLNGILIYRDARIEPGFPVHRIRLQDAGEGDLLYFPGHVAMYLGDGRFIHATGMAGCSGVMMGSLIPGEKGYRKDLAESLCEVGSIF